MPDAVYEQDLTIPAGNGSKGIYFNAVNLGLSDVQEIMIVFPPGCAGLVGVVIQYAVNPVYPNANGSYYVLDDYVLTIPVSGQQKAGQWRIAGYNQDTFPHTIRSYWSYNYLTVPEVTGTSPLISL
jgi:hypothetical protein